MAKVKQEETYAEWYARKLGPVGHYSTMTPRQLGERHREVIGLIGNMLFELRRHPESLTANEMLPLLDAHNAAIKEAIHTL